MMTSAAAVPVASRAGEQREEEPASPSHTNIESRNAQARTPGRDIAASPSMSSCPTRSPPASRARSRRSAAAAAREMSRAIGRLKITAAASPEPHRMERIATPPLKAAGTLTERVSARPIPSTTSSV
jgi:hypothetical protein